MTPPAVAGFLFAYWRSSVGGDRVRPGHRSLELRFWRASVVPIGTLVSRHATGAVLK
jgi:hypothetical protein